MGEDKESFSSAHVTVPQYKNEERPLAVQSRESTFGYVVGTRPTIQLRCLYLNQKILLFLYQDQIHSLVDT
jgi:hypothetical protein